ncbi:Hypothetical protein PYTT_0302 [Akkermansia glycaniphila]|uniref:Uncharacterized protein n=1 Tax=Akkermansia glycaniphila TaxID=1679444 RepID=A0A1H6KMZ8_9BACT|nr:Hypothetical protein PYTT_0302 [Akkermansia glycaniphila]
MGTPGVLICCCCWHAPTAQDTATRTATLAMVGYVFRIVVWYGWTFMIGNCMYGSKREGMYRKLRTINHPAQEFAALHALCLSWQVSPWPVRYSDGRTHARGLSLSHPATPEQPRFSPDKKVLLQETSQAAAGTRPWRRIPPQGRPLWPKRDKLVWLYYCMVVLSYE